MSGDRVLASQLLPFGIQVSDLEYIALWTFAAAVVISLIGIVLLRLLASRSMSLMITVVVAASVLASMAGVGVIVHRMIGTPSDRDVMMTLIPIGALAGLAVALVVARRMTKASRALSSAVQGVGDNGVYVPPSRTLPAELSELSAELTATHERLAQARSRERALEASRRELVAWVSHDLRSPLAGLRAMA